MGLHHFLILHLLGAAVWVGGHLVLAIGILPEVLRKHDVAGLLNFERKYEPIGMPALIVQVITGVWMALQFGIGPNRWFHFADPVERAVSAKLLLLLLTVGFALSARFFVIPKLRPQTLPLMAFHIISVTVLGVLMLIIGSLFRLGGMG